MAGNKPSTDVDESKKKIESGKKEKEIKPEKPRWEVKWHKDFKKQEEDFATLFTDLTKKGVLETLQKKLPDNFKDAKSYDEAMEILRDGKWVERLWIHKDMYERLDLNVKKHEESEKQKKEVEKKKEELKEDKKDDEKKNEKKDNKKLESKEEKKSEDKNEKPEDKKESGKKPESEKSKDKKDDEKKSEKKASEKSEEKEGDDIEADKKKEKSEKKWFFWSIGSFLGKTSTQAGNLIRYPFRATRNWLKMAWRSLKYFWFDILNFPSWGEAMKKIWAKYQEDMKKYAGKFKWNYKKGGK